MIACELCYQKEMKHHSIAVAFGLDKGLNENQYGAITQRGKRLCDKGRPTFLKEHPECAKSCVAAVV
jgi:hypothetical protein